MKRRGFTLIELLVVVIVVAVLLALAAGALGRAHDRAESGVCAMRQRDIVAASIMTIDSGGHFRRQSAFACVEELGLPEGVWRCPSEPLPDARESSYAFWPRVLMMRRWLQTRGAMSDEALCREAWRDRQRGIGAVVSDIRDEARGHHLGVWMDLHVEGTW